MLFACRLFVNQIIIDNCITASLSTFLIGERKEKLMAFASSEVVGLS